MRRGTLIAYVRRDDARNGAPLVPASWDLIEESDRWSTLYPLTRAEQDVYFHARLMVPHPTLPRGLYVCVGTPLILAHLASRIASDGLPWTRTWVSLTALRADATEVASQLRSQWPATDVDGTTPRILARMAGYSSDDAEE